MTHNICEVLLFFESEASKSLIMPLVSDTLKIMTYMVPVWMNYGPRDHAASPHVTPEVRVEEYPYNPGECRGRDREGKKNESCDGMLVMACGLESSNVGS